MEISEIKSRLSILTVIEHYGYKPNRNQMLKCPFHEDKTPSLQLYPKTETWYCFGCGKGSDQIDFIEQEEKCSKAEAIKKAKAMTCPATSGVGETGKKVKNQQPARIEDQNREPITESQRIEVLTQAFGYFCRSLQQTERAKAYLKERNLNPEKLTVGYGSQVFHRSKEVTAKLKKLYLAAGLIYPDKLGRKDSYHGFFNNCVVLPTFNEQGQIVNLYGRNTEEKGAKHRYLPGGHRGLYPKYPDTETEVLVLTESLIDAASLLQSGSKLQTPYSVLACYGTNGFTDEHEAAIKELKHLKEVVLFFDGDQAGKQGVEKIAETLQKLKTNLKVTYVETPEGEDVNSLLNSHEPEILTHLIASRKCGVESLEKEAESLKLTGVESNPLETKQEKAVTSSPHSTLPTSNSEPNSQLPTPNLDSTNREQLLFENSYLIATVWGGIDIYNIKKLRATLHLQSRQNQYLEYRDTVDLYSHSQTSRLVREAGEKLESGSHAMSQSIAELTRALEQYRQEERDKERKKEEAEKNRNKERFTAEELRAGESFLKDEKLMEQTRKQVSCIGLVGEEEKGLLLFFILLTRMFKDPLHALVQGKSGSGKTYLLKKIASLVPKAHIRVTTALTENTLYHSLEDFWKHMILLIEDLDGAFNALLPLREMMSNQSISKLSTEKNLKTGEFEQKILYVEGPVCVAGATTKDRIYEDNANRSFLIQVNESPQHQENVLDYQRKEIAGLLDKSKEQTAQTILKTAQLNLEPLEVVIPFGEALRIPEYVFKKLRTNAHYLTLIKAIAFWHQKQRAIKQKPDGTKYLEATLEDVEWANGLSKEVLLRKSDELSGALRGFFEGLKSWLQERKEGHDYRQNTFYAKPLRERFRMNPMQVNRYLKELDQRGYIKQAGGNKKTGFEYRVQIWDDYEQLKDGLDILDKTLETLKEKYKK